MSTFLLTSVSGWFALFMVLASAMLPYLVRRGLGGGRPELAGVYRGRLQAHVWIGFIILAVAVVHMMVPMTGGLMAGANATGLNIATVALLVVLVQVIMGLKLVGATGMVRAAVRRWHVVGLAVIVILTAIHAALNSPLFSVR